MWCCSLTDGEGLWYTNLYPEDFFFDHWQDMAMRFKDNQRVIGADLRNELRSAEINGQIIEPTWGDGNRVFDLKNI